MAVEGNRDDPTASGPAAVPATAADREARLDAELAAMRLDDEPAQRPESPAQLRAAELAAFRARLALLTPRIVVTPTFIAVNVLVFAVMVARGVSPLAPTTDDLLSWGANLGRLSTGGQWWRLLTAMFLHVGIIHLLMNMWALWEGGRLVERMLGPVAFAAAYLLAGAAGSCASALWSPDRPSAGASGAIFGIFGVLGAFLLRQRRAMPPAALSALSRSTLFFVGYNVIYGLTKPNIDMAAHLGGLAGGFVAGLPLVRALTPEARAGSFRRAALVTAVGLGAFALLWSNASAFLAMRAEASLRPRELPGAAVNFPAATDPQDRLDYEDGQIQSKWSEPGWLQLSWGTSEMMTDTELRRGLLDPLVFSLWKTVPDVTVEAAEVVVAGSRGIRYLVSDGHRRRLLAASVWPCGKRVFTLMGQLGGVGLEPAVRGSFTCTPDAARDGAHRPIGVEVDAGSEFGLLDTQGASTVGVASLDGDVILVARLPGSRMTEESRAELLPQFFGQILGAALDANTASFGPMTRERGPAGERPVWHGTGRGGGQALRLLVVEIDCGPDHYLGIYYGGVARPEARGLGPLLGARCAAAPRRPPPIAEVARAACARGDKRGCDF